MKYWLWTLAVLSLTVLILCGCEPREAYYSPYGDGVDVNTITTGSYTRAPTMTTTGLVIVSTTTTAGTTVPTRLAAPQKDHVVCPDCHGIMEPCRYCKGTLYRKGEMYDPDSDIFRKYKIRCNMCADDPGYEICPTCRNALLVPNNTL